MATEAKHDVSTEIADQNIKTNNELPAHNASCLTKEFRYMFHQRGYEAPTRGFFDLYDKVQFYTGLPSCKIFIVVLEHVSSPVAYKTLSLDRFQEFVMVLKLTTSKFHSPLCLEFFLG